MTLTSAVPENSTMGLLLAGLPLIVALRRLAHGARVRSRFLRRPQR
jgi:hypothetical protein